MQAASKQANGHPEAIHGGWSPFLVVTNMYYHFDL